MKAGQPTMIDSTIYAAMGLDVPDSLKKYSATVDQDGNIVKPSRTAANLKYKALYEQMVLQDLKEYTNRFKSANIPVGLNQNLIERILYYRFKGLFYYNEEVAKFQFLPFALNGGIDEYGRYTHANSLPFTGVSVKSKDKKTPEKKYTKSNIEIVYDDLIPIGYNPEDPNSITQEEMIRIRDEWENGSDKGIILNDYTLGISQMQPSRYDFIKPVISSMATCMQIINTAMFASADYNLVKAQNEDEYHQLMSALNASNERILQGHRFGGVYGALNMDSLKTTNSSSIQDLWECFNSLDNYRKTTAGIANSGVFNKKERMLQQEQMLNGSNADDIYTDALYQRQKACDLINQYYGINMWYFSKYDGGMITQNMGAMQGVGAPGNTNDNNLFQGNIGGEENDV